MNISATMAYKLEEAYQIKRMRGEGDARRISLEDSYENLVSYIGDNICDEITKHIEFCYDVTARFNPIGEIVFSVKINNGYDTLNVVEKITEDALPKRNGDVFILIKDSTFEAVLFEIDKFTKNILKQQKDHLDEAIQLA
mgnify:CR=1 FL=1